MTILSKGPQARIINRNPGARGFISGFGASGGGGGARVPAPASATSGWRREHLTQDGSGFIDGINDPVGPGTAFSFNGNVQGHPAIGIDTDSFTAAIYMEVSGFDGTQNIALRIRETGTSFTQGILLAHPSNASSFIGVHAANATAANNISTADDIYVGATQLGAVPTRQQVYDAIGVNPSNPTVRDVAVIGADGSTTFRPIWYSTGAFQGKYVIEGAMLYTSEADTADVFLWLGDMDVYAGPPSEQKVATMNRMAATRYPANIQQIATFNRVAATRFPTNTQQIATLNRVVMVRSL